MQQSSTTPKSKMWEWGCGILFHALKSTFTLVHSCIDIHVHKFLQLIDVRKCAEHMGVGVLYQEAYELLALTEISSCTVWIHVHLVLSLCGSYRPGGVPTKCWCSGEGEE